MHIILDLIIRVITVLLLFIMTIIIEAYRITIETEEGDITEIFPGLFHLLGVHIGVLNKGSYDWEILIITNK